MNSSHSVLDTWRLRVVVHWVNGDLVRFLIKFWRPTRDYRTRPRYLTVNWEKSNRSLGCWVLRDPFRQCLISTSSRESFNSITVPGPVLYFPFELFTPFPKTRLQHIFKVGYGRPRQESTLTLPRPHVKPLTSANAMISWNRSLLNPELRNSPQYSTLSYAPCSGLPLTSHLPLIHQED